MENILINGPCLSPYTCKCYIVFKQFDGLKFDAPAGKRQKFQISPIKILRYMVHANNLTMMYIANILHLCYLL